MTTETHDFLRVLFAACPADSCLTLTAIHPDRDRASPSRHIAVDDTAALSEALGILLRANADHGYGAYVGVATRRPGLSRWQRGGRGDLVSLPALFVDIDRTADEALRDLGHFALPPSAVVLSGHGVHAYWLLREPLTDLGRANKILAALAGRLRGDALSVAHCMRLPGSLNTKRERGNAMCRLHTLQPDRRYDLAAFEPLIPSARRPRVAAPMPRHRLPTAVLNPLLVTAVADCFAARGYRRRDGWLNGPCPFPEHHKRGDAHRSFGYVESESLSRGQTLSAHFSQRALPKTTCDYLANGAPVGRRNRALFAAACHFRDAGYAMTEAEHTLVPRYLADSVGDESRRARACEARRTLQSAYSRSPRLANRPLNQYRSGR